MLLSKLPRYKPLRRIQFDDTRLDQRPDQCRMAWTISPSTPATRYKSTIFQGFKTSFQTPDLRIVLFLLLLLYSLHELVELPQLLICPTSATLPPVLPISESPKTYHSSYQSSPCPSSPQSTYRPPDSARTTAIPSRSQSASPSAQILVAPIPLRKNNAGNLQCAPDSPHSYDF